MSDRDLKSHQDDQRDPPASYFWTTTYAEKMRATLGIDACRKLAIFPLPKGFLLSVIVPVYNEGNTVASVIDRLRATGIPMQIIIVDDGSQDSTPVALAELSQDNALMVFSHEQNRGKGAAIRTGIAKATGDIVVIQDADQEYDPSDFRYLLQPLIAGEADVAYGTRYGHYDRQLSPWWHQAVNGLITYLASIAIGIRLSDVETCYKMVPREHLHAIQDQLCENRFGIEIELTARLARQNLRFTERPIRYRHRWYDEGKKIGWRDGVSALWCILKYGLLRR
ncbi:glycosyltransferase family 2 protein [Roseiconus lacunae]|uniref:Glycosyltransferase family 2 protein n=1 Tax=Roseiconus lacunae TaxID=2605694 RepID=A0ABT7PEX7_9BACT|nr:glycosyltransferase family 2 protein [Roseiconus lacunae]MCD0462247.1 glycosyltransferase family 2 protein [Roseiconus lacunae]MDM4015048.1 glycosyltransferase family 2 protein [Roseiconus lacunae]WRQ50180.1 glycosyltransferase family 2 protein [Stieleria sp. HD01]